MKRLMLLMLLIQILLGQNVPFIMDHPVYHFLEKQESLGRINGEYWSTRPFTYSQINRMLDEIRQHAPELSPREMQKLQRFDREFNREISAEGITFPWSRSTLDALIHPADQELRPFFMSYKLKDTRAWINWSETFRTQHNGKGARGYHTDYLGIFGERGSLAFTSQFTLHRVTRSDHFTDLPDTYKEGYLLDREYMQWINWDYPTSSLVYSHKDFTLAMHRQPIYWGYSETTSPILSDNTSPLAHLEWTTTIKHLRFKFIHARLTGNDPIIKDTSNVRRNMSAHRVEFDITPNFEFAFNEMVIYAHRDFELGYLNPVNFLFAEEHAQGDRDNKLMALDFKWRVRPGLTSYGAWFIDELDFFKLFSGWWGNKFVFQLGASYYPKLDLPSLTLEYTAARPWTYTHTYPFNSFTSAGVGLGLPQGPNSQIFRLASSWQANHSLYLKWEYLYTQQGADPGADLFNKPSDYLDFDDETNSFLTGNLVTSRLSSISGQYYFSPVMSISGKWVAGEYAELGLRLDW